MPPYPWNRVDNTTAELLGIALGRHVVARLHRMGAQTVEQVCVAEGAAAAEAPPERQKHPLRRALQWAIEESAVAHWLVKSHEEVSSLVSEGDVRKMGNILVDAQPTDALRRSAHGERVAVPLQLLPTFGVRPTAQGADGMVYPFGTEMATATSHPSEDDPLLCENPETGMALVPLHLGVWHPTLEACPRCDRHEEVTTRFRCPCHKRRWRKALRTVDPPWRLHGAGQRCACSPPQSPLPAPPLPAPLPPPPEGASGQQPRGGG